MVLKTRMCKEYKTKIYRRLSFRQIAFGLSFSRSSSPIVPCVYILLQSSFDLKPSHLFSHSLSLYIVPFLFFTTTLPSALFFYRPAQNTFIPSLTHTYIHTIIIYAISVRIPNIVVDVLRGHRGLHLV